MYETIVVSTGAVSSVNEDGSAKEELSASEPRWTCTEHGASFAEWDVVVEHWASVHEQGSEGAAEEQLEVSEQVEVQPEGEQLSAEG